LVENIDIEAANQLLDLTNQFAEAFWTAKGVETKRQPSNQAAGGEDRGIAQFHSTDVVVAREGADEVVAASRARVADVAATDVKLGRSQCIPQIA
jgi:hypothetical protein